jgi:predicted Fe-Mo cluster-binding NifX family protein
MNIAIPSNDLIHISGNFYQADKLVIFTAEQNKITDEECFDTKTCSEKQSILDCLKDHAVKVVIQKNADKETEQLLGSLQIELYITNETLITNIITDYIREQNLKESNYCCCP